MLEKKLLKTTMLSNMGQNNFLFKQKASQGNKNKKNNKSNMY